MLFLKTSLMSMMIVNMICINVDDIVVSEGDKEEILHSSTYSAAYQKYMSKFYPDDTGGNHGIGGSYEQIQIRQQNEKKKQRQFISSVKMANKHNRIYNEGLSSYTMTVNYFSVMEPEERMKHMGLMPQNSTNTKERLLRAEWPPSRMLRAAVPEELCWKTKGYVTDVKDQGQCASCWAFATVVCLEYIYKKVSGNLISLSEQELLDCTYERGSSNGCNGGWYTDSFGYLKVVDHTPTMQDYPYKGVDGKCMYKNHTNAIKDMLTFDYYWTPKFRSVDDMIYTIVNHGPVAVAVYIGNDFFSYSKGIYNGCKEGITRPNHGIAIVGYAKDHFLIKNSWGAQWGEGGYMRMAKRNTCGLLEHGFYMKYTVTPEFEPSKSDEDESPPGPRCKDKKETSTWHCSYWAQKGACADTKANKTRRKFMGQYCPDTCGMCSDI